MSFHTPSSSMRAPQLWSVLCIRFWNTFLILETLCYLILSRYCLSCDSSPSTLPFRKGPGWFFSIPRAPSSVALGKRWAMWPPLSVVHPIHFLSLVFFLFLHCSNWIPLWASFFQDVGSFPKGELWLVVHYLCPVVHYRKPPWSSLRPSPTSPLCQWGEVIPSGVSCYTAWLFCWHLDYLRVLLSSGLSALLGSLLGISLPLLHQLVKLYKVLEKLTVCIYFNPMYSILNQQGLK